LRIGAIKRQLIGEGGLHGKRENLADAARPFVVSESLCMGWLRQIDESGGDRAIFCQLERPGTEHSGMGGHDHRAGRRLDASGRLSGWVALALAVFCLITGFAIHLPGGDLPNMINFYKNLSITGGLLYVAAYGAGYLSVDGPSK
jgi:hypothetical protein